MPELLFVLLMVVLVIAGLVLVAPRLIAALLEGQIRREAEQAHTAAPVDADPLLADLDPQYPTLVYFTADWCAPCRLTQSPIIERLQQDDAVQVVTVDVEVAQDTAQRWQVRSLPRTFVLRPGFVVHATNIGVATEETLREQIAAARTTSGDTPIQVTTEELAKPSLKIGTPQRQQARTED